MSAFFVKHDSNPPFEIKTHFDAFGVPRADPLTNVAQAVGAVKQTLSAGLAPFDVNQLSLRLPLAVARPSSGLSVACFLSEENESDATLDPGCALSALLALDIGVSSKRPLRLIVNSNNNRERLFKRPHRHPELLAASTRTSKKQRTTDLKEMEIKKKWTVNGTIRPNDIAGCFYVNPLDNEETIVSLQKIVKGQFLMLVGARASGKSTRFSQLCLALKTEGLNCIFVTLELVSLNGCTSDFWRSLAIQCQKYYRQRTISIGSGPEFAALFSAQLWEKPVVLLIDEFDKLDDASEEIREDCLNTFRGIRNAGDSTTAIRSISVCGTFSIRRLNTQAQKTSPFNTSECVANPYFTEEQTKSLYDEYAVSEGITLDDRIVKDIHWKSAGHPGMVCLCGKAIAENLRCKVDISTRTLSYEAWQTFCSSNLNYCIGEYSTFRRMVASLTTPKARNSVDLLRSWLIGYLEDVWIADGDVALADFLTAEGVLLSCNAENTYRMASPLIDSYIRRAIRRQYPLCPSGFVPKQGSSKRVDVLQLLREALKFFDPDLIRLAHERSYKLGIVGNHRNTQVPRESVYDTELMRILSNWLTPLHGYTVTGQWHLKEDRNHKYCDIVVKSIERTVVFELLATGGTRFIESHISKTPDYKRLVLADEAWVIHFSRDPNVLDAPVWQSVEQLNDGVNVVHIWHNAEFTEGQMSASWMDEDGLIQTIDKEPLVL
ncbi:hypothetical protein BDR26DRAFT_874030 [Obelidium mucronatum]|nr:hypothetical protein BDR26DRAFT_874030 [Obelidium mucronatum]